MKSSTVAGFVSLIALTPLALWGGKKVVLPPGAERAGVITAVLRNAELVRGSASDMRADFGSELTRDDVLRTDGNGRVKVRLDKTLVSIGSNTELRMAGSEAGSGRSVLQLSYGRMRVQSRGQSPTTIEVQTPDGVATVRGADVGIDASTPGKVSFICLEGTVQVASSASNSPVTCETGHAVTIEQGHAPLRPEVADIAVTAYWRNITDTEEQPAIQYFP